MIHDTRDGKRSNSAVLYSSMMLHYILLKSPTKHFLLVRKHFLLVQCSVNVGQIHSLSDNTQVVKNKMFTFVFI